jgi:hypothetical protein
MSRKLPYFGEVYEGSFLLRPTDFVVDGFRPVIDGSVAEGEGGCTVAFSARPSWVATCVVTAWLILFLAFDAALVHQEYKAGRPPRLAMLLPIAVVLLVYAGWVWTVARAGRRFEGLLRSVKA